MKNKTVDACYVMSLPRMGRLEGFYAGLPADWPFPRPEHFHGIDAQRVPLPSWWSEIPAMYGCNESHKGIMANALSRGFEQVFIFEDDCRFVPGAVQMILRAMEDVPDDWHGFMIGGQISVFDGKTSPITDRISRCIQVERNHAYMLSRRGLEEFYRCLCEPSSVPIDHRWGDLQEAGKVNVYRMEPFVAFQAEGESSISGHVEPARIWDERQNVRLRNPAEVPIVSLSCPFDVLKRMRDEGIVTNGGEYPPQFAEIPNGRVEKGEKWIADVLLHAAQDDPHRARNFVEAMRGDAAFHRSAALVLWHPDERIPYPDVPYVSAQTYEQAIEQIALIT